MASTESIWAPSSWSALRAVQQPHWPDPAPLDAVRERLQSLDLASRVAELMRAA